MEKETFSAISPVCYTFFFFFFFFFLFFSSQFGEFCPISLYNIRYGFHSRHSPPCSPPPMTVSLVSSVCMYVCTCWTTSWVVVGHSPRGRAPLITLSLILSHQWHIPSF
ncbi:hypothetical protein QBC45DRAFT_162637 [Copromyces sp. CBS 386.78]|nr:hypothetical protein QBC45DRAFT_162637 [Copromyces sp. CBS 386.78]